METFHQNLKLTIFILTSKKMFTIIRLEIKEYQALATVKH